MGNKTNPFITGDTSTSATDASTNSFGSSLTPPQINIDCNVGEFLKFPLIGSFFKTLIYTIFTPLLFVFFLLPIIITLFVTIQSCKTITFDTFNNIQFVIQKINEPSYYIPILVIVAYITLTQIGLIYAKDYFLYSLLAIILFLSSIITYIVQNQSILIQESMD